MRVAGAVLLTVWVGACASRVAGPPALVIDRSACSQCGMLISERAHAAAMVWPDGRNQLFDDVGCLVTKARQLAPLPSDVHYWFHDASDGNWIDGASPVFVTSASLKTPMGGGIVAFRDRASAERFANQHAGRILSSVAALIEDDGGKR